RGAAGRRARWWGRRRDPALRALIAAAAVAPRPGSAERPPAAGKPRGWPRGGFGSAAPQPELHRVVAGAEPAAARHLRRLGEPAREVPRPVRVAAERHGLAARVAPPPHQLGGERDPGVDLECPAARGEDVEDVA